MKVSQTRVKHIGSHVEKYTKTKRQKNISHKHVEVFIKSFNLKKYIIFHLIDKVFPEYISHGMEVFGLIYT